jgi:hypothetical protein
LLPAFVPRMRRVVHDEMWNPIAEAPVGGGISTVRHGAVGFGGRYGPCCADQNGIRLKWKATVKLKAPLVDRIMGRRFVAERLRNPALYDGVGQRTCPSRWRHQCSPPVPVPGSPIFGGAQGWQLAPVERRCANGLEPFRRSDRRRRTAPRTLSKLTRRADHAFAGPRITRPAAG